MKIEQIYTNCLAHAAYYVESEGEAVIIDPLRETTPYLEKANQNHAKIKYIFETHFHADFVSGHLDLAKKTGATIVYGPTSSANFDFHIGKDGEIFRVGKVTFELLHTPGHTMESSCFLLRDESGKEVALFSGDTLFIGDVGRPDLAQALVSELTQDKLAGYLYDSLHHKILPLSDEVIVYPSHGHGSACGKNLSKETFDTLGNQKKTNYALDPHLSKENFVKEVINGLMPPPAYFPNNVIINKKGYETFDEVLDRNMKPLSVTEFEELANQSDILVLDTRHQDEFVKGFIPNSLFVGLHGEFAPWVGTVIQDINQKIIFISEKGKEKEVITRLARVGYENVLGYLEGGFESWLEAKKPIDKIENIEVESLETIYSKDPSISILDVRKASEYNSQHIKNAENHPLNYIVYNLTEINPNKKHFVHCAGGYRSVIFISILKRNGIHDLINIKSGFNQLVQSDVFPKTEYVCPTTML